MSNWTDIQGWVYTRVLRLYPGGFRAVFGDEMRAVFMQALETDARTGRALRFVLRELKDLPGSVLRQHWLAIKKEQAHMSTLTESNGIPLEERQPGTWRAACLAGLPHLLMGLLIWVGRLGFFDAYDVSQTGNVIVGMGLALLVIGVLVYAWRRGWPLWSASWYLYGTWLSLVIIGLTIESLNLEESWRYTNALFVGWILLCIVGYFVLLSKSKLHGLLSVAFLFPMLSVMMLEFVPNPIEGWLALGVGLGGGRVPLPRVENRRRRSAPGGFLYVVWTGVGVERKGESKAPYLVQRELPALIGPATFPSPWPIPSIPTWEVCAG